MEVQDDWPPVGAECLHCEKVADGFKIDSVPFFVRNLSADDVIEVVEEDNGEVWRWRHVTQSPRSTVWVMNLGNVELETTFARLKELGCRIEAFDQFKLYALDIPTSVEAAVIDDCFEGYEESDVALAYPSWRHDERDA